MITQRQKDVLNHIIEEEPQFWYDNAVLVLGQEAADAALDAKVLKYEADYDSAVLAGNYKNRNQRDADAAQAELDAWASDLATAKTKRIAELKIHLGIQYATHVDYHYAKKRRKSDRGKPPYAIPIEVEQYEDLLEAVSTSVDNTINSMTDIQSIKNYWPDLPVEP